MSIEVKVAGVWRQVATCEVRVAGVWRKARVFTRVGGVWKPVLPIIQLGAEEITRVSSPTAICGIRYNANGSIHKLEGLTYSDADLVPAWATDTSIVGLANYWVSGQQIAGSGTIEGTMNTQLDLSTDREWTLTASGNTRTGTLRVQIGLGSLVLATADVELTAEGDD